MKKIYILIILIIAAPFAVFANGDQGMDEGHQMMENMMSWGSWGSSFGWIFMVSVWILVILGIIALIKWLIDSSKK